MDEQRRSRVHGCTIQSLGLVYIARRRLLLEVFFLLTVTASETSCVQLQSRALSTVRLLWCTLLSERRLWVSDCSCRGKTQGEARPNERRLSKISMEIEERLQSRIGSNSTYIMSKAFTSQTCHIPAMLMFVFVQSLQHGANDPQYIAHDPL